MVRNALVVVAIGCALVFACGCVFKMGAVEPTWGRTEGTITSGADLYLSLSTPEEVGKGGVLIAFPFEQYRTPVEHSAGFSKGTLRTDSLGTEFRIRYLVFFRDKPAVEVGSPGKPELDPDIELQLPQHRDQTLTYFWFGFGPEYHWNKFVVSSTDLVAAADDRIYYDEKFKNNWGGRISLGIQTMTRTHHAQTGRAHGNIGFMVELSYHWGTAQIEQRGTDNGVPFRKTRMDKLEWLSVFAGFVVEF